MADVLAGFHPLIQAWFHRRFAGPTDAQAAGWPVIQAGRDVLIAAPTGSGKTLAAFLAGIDVLIKEADAGTLPTTTQIVYVSPLKALGNDIQRNLEAPLGELKELADELGLSMPALRVGVRTGDTPAKDRQAMVKTPAHILITTPESLYLMLTAARSRETLRHVRTVIVDEIHALARDKRGSHLALSLTRLDHITERAQDAPEAHESLRAQTRPARIGLSATQRPVEEIAAFLVGTEEQTSRRADAQIGGADGQASQLAGVRVGSRSTEGAAPLRGGMGGDPPNSQITNQAEQRASDAQPGAWNTVSVEERDCVIVDLGHQRDIELHIEVPPSDLEAVAAKEQWGDIYDRLAGLVRAHRTTLIFVNTRRLSERVAHNLTERLGEEAVASHHGSLSRDRRLRVEQRLKSGELKALVCTASLELGIDIGSIDLVCQVGSPRSVATFLQRVGRSGHALGLRPQGRLFPASRDELVECAALVRAVRAGRLDRIVQPRAPLDVLAQQIVAECACEDWPADDLFALMRRATQYRDLTREDFDEIVEMLAEGVGEGPGRAPPLLYYDRINGMLRGRRGARMTAILNGGTIPEMADYRVIAEPDDTVVGTVGEDWAIESMAGDIFLLGSHSWRIRRVAAAEVRVEDAHGAPPTIPFWVGEAPGRTLELSQEVGRLRRDVIARLEDEDGLRRLQDETGLDELGAVQIVDYLRASRDALGVIPSDTDVVFERFFDETGGMQLIVHAPFGAKINRAWGLTLRKRFCVRFDFELQAAASDDSIVLSLGPQHSFPLEEAFAYVTSRNAAESLRQAVIYAPVFPVRWRWDAGRALAVPRFTGARKVPPPIQRMRADDLLAAVFPAQVGCQENVAGPLQIPDHPLVRQTVDDCLHEAMDLDGLIEVLRQVEAGEVRLHAIDTLEPSPMAHEILSGKPYTYLDDAPLEERRTRAVTLRRALPESARELGALDADAIARVSDEAWPAPRDAEETHDALLGLVVVPAVDAAIRQPWVDGLIETGRAAKLSVAAGNLAGGQSGKPEASAPFEGYFAAENLHLVEALYPQGRVEPALTVPEGALVHVEDRDEARRRLLLGWTEASGPVSAAGLAARLGLGSSDVEYGLRGIEAQGFVLRGHFTPSVERAIGPAGNRAGEQAGSPPEHDDGEPVKALASDHPEPVEGSSGERVQPSQREGSHEQAAHPERVEPSQREGSYASSMHPERVQPSQREGSYASSMHPERVEPSQREGSYASSMHPERVQPIDEYCDRRLLARIHRYTLDRLRREIDPVSTQDYLRFLLRWQHLTPDTRLAGKTGVRQAIARLQGFEAAAASWERDLLAARVSDYRASWLDELCLAGEVVWARLTPRKAATAGASPTRATPLTVALRRDFGTLLSAVRGAVEPATGPKAGAAAEILDLLRGRGALFFDEIVNGTRRLRSDVERGMRELVAWGLVTADGFQGLRQLLGRSTAPSGRRRDLNGGGSSYNAAGFFAGSGPAGRWALIPSVSALESASAPDKDDLAEAAANVLLQRYGVVFRDLYARESFTLPWRDLLRALRRLEARGQIRGGRFVSGAQGEQYALPDAVDALRWVRRQERAGERVWVSAVDPVNLAGVLVQGEKVPALPGRGVLFVDGLPEPADAAPPKQPVPSKLTPRRLFAGRS